MTSDVLLVLRAGGERSVPAAAKALEAVEPGATFEKVELSPLGRSLDHTLRRALELDVAWAVVCDADVVVSPAQVRRGISLARTMPADYLVLTMTVEDWLFGHPRTLGLRIYQIRHAEEALRCLQEQPNPRRPESSMISALSAAGRPSALTTLTAGIHDRYQWNRDLYRKGVFFAHKHVPRLPILVERWRNLSDQDDDFRAALLGLSDGLMDQDPGANLLSFDTDAIDARLAASGLQEKQPLTADEITAITARVASDIPMPPAVPTWTTDPLPADLIGQWREFRRGGLRHAAIEMRDLYNRLGARSIPKNFVRSFKPTS